MRKGEVWQVNINPVKGSEQAGIRPVVIVSGDLLNEYASVVWVCPLTTKIKIYKGNVLLKPNKLNGLKKESEILNLHLRAISKDRLVVQVGEITKEQLIQTRKGLQEIMEMD
jgi:mRNA interferase MazF|tara:strand:+ start:46 stop:381 length:336 start_codon:yes stop_codon:yes gene_type:complete